MENCPFCNRDKIPTDKFMRDGYYYFEPLNPVVPGHLLVVPFKHATDFAEDLDTTALVMRGAADIAREQGGSFNLITSKGYAASQSVFHLHVHLIPRKEGDDLKLPWTGQKPITPHTEEKEV